MSDKTLEPSAKTHRLLVLATVPVGYESGFACRRALVPHGGRQGLRLVLRTAPCSNGCGTGLLLSSPTCLRHAGPVALPRSGHARVNDALAEGGSAVGVYTAVLAARTERVLCLACDMPFVTARLLWELAERSEGYDVFVPRHGEFMQPLCAVYSKRTLDAYREFILAGGRRIFDIYPDLNTGFLDGATAASGIPRSCLSMSTHPRNWQQRARRWPRGPVRAGARRSSPASRPSWTRPLYPSCRSSARRNRARRRWSSGSSRSFAAEAIVWRSSSTTLTGSRWTFPAPIRTVSARWGRRWWGSRRPTSTCGSQARTKSGRWANSSARSASRSIW